MKRNESLDILRGLAILAMVLSGSIAFHILPGWMYHAQVPPPDHKFDANLPGITWVDLVFPFFLFAMGAAIPLSLHKRFQSGEEKWKIALHIIYRYAMLVFFAIFTQHARAWVIAKEPAASDYFLSIGCFILLFFIYTDLKKSAGKMLAVSLRVLAILLALVFFYFNEFSNGNGFDFYRSDIIIVVLANMALFGSFVWWITKDKPVLRIGMLPFIMAVFLASTIKESWNEKLYNFTLLPWAYKFYYLKYLFIILPGTLAGEWMLKRSSLTVVKESNYHTLWLMLALLGLALVITNTTFLYTRKVELNLFITIPGVITMLFFLQKFKSSDAIFEYRKKIIEAGCYLVLLGLFFEAYEGGIKKDYSTYSYYFVTSGLAFFILLWLDVFSSRKGWSSILNYFGTVGKNPMVAYVAGNLLLIPLLNLTGAIRLFDYMLDHGQLLGFFRGIIFTGIVSLITYGFVKMKWFWKT